MPAMHAGFIKFRGADRREGASMMKLPAVGVILIPESAALWAQPRRLNPELKYTVSPSESQAEFYVHSTLADVNGVFSSYQAEFKVLTSRFEDISFTIDVGAASVRTGNGAKDKMVKGERFFCVESHPSITFASKRIVPDPGNPMKFAMGEDFIIRSLRSSPRATNVDAYMRTCPLTVGSSA
jgi:hypothetical protein